MKRFKKDDLYTMLLEMEFQFFNIFVIPGNEKDLQGMRLC